MNVATLDPPARRPTTTGVRASVAALVATILLLAAIALAANWSVVKDLSAPGLDIQFRELSAAQTIVDQGFGPDATYLHEHVWYNPMTAWIAVAASRVSGVALPTVIARGGPFVNVAAPVALFLLVATTVDAFAAAAAVAAFVFLVGTGLPFYYSAAYSPWFAPENVGQAFLYLFLALAYRACRPDAALGWAVACGIALGATFLVHTAPAIVGGLVFVAYALSETRLGRDSARAWARIGVALAVAFVVSLPFGFEILWYYHLRVVNPFPSQSPSDLLDLNELPALIRTLATLPVAVAIAGFGYRIVARFDRGTRLLVIWLAVVVGLLALHVGALVLRKAGIDLPGIVPAFHFLFYLMAITAVGFGIGVRDGAEALMKRLEAGSWSGALTCAVALLWVVAAFPRYIARADFTDLRREAVAMNARYPSDVVSWIRSHSAPDDVFLCSDDASMYVVAPAGRKVVATNRYFSNPYVDWASRDTDRQRMFEELQRGNVEGFAALAQKYEVGFVVLSQDRSEAWLRAAGMRPADLPDLDRSVFRRLPRFTLELNTRRFAIARFDRLARASGAR